MRLVILTKKVFDFISFRCEITCAYRHVWDRNAKRNASRTVDALVNFFFRTFRFGFFSSRVCSPFGAETDTREFGSRPARNTAWPCDSPSRTRGEKWSRSTAAGRGETIYYYNYYYNTTASWPSCAGDVLRSDKKSSAEDRQKGPPPPPPRKSLASRLEQQRGWPVSELMTGNAVGSQWFSTIFCSRHTTIDHKFSRHAHTLAYLTDIFYH